MLHENGSEVPDVLGAIKRSVDDDYRPGRFILTGSVRSALETKMWPGTGRLIRLNIHSMTQRELNGFASPSPRVSEHSDSVTDNATPTFFDKLATCDPNAFPLPDGQADLRDYVELALHSGFPTAALHTPKSEVGEWLQSYLEQLLHRDLESVASGTSQEKFGTYFQMVAANSAGSPADNTLSTAAKITHETADRYDTILESLFLAERISHWSTNALNQLTKQTKRYIIEPAFLASVRGLDINGVLSDGDLLGRLIDTFVMAQLRPEVTLFDKGTQLFHLRTRGGRQEVDIIAQHSDGSIMGLELKASATPTVKDAKHLIWLRDRIGEKFTCGAVIHTGPSVFQLDDRILAIPIRTLWG